MKTDFNRDELARITWQKLKPVEKRSDPRATHGQLKGLRDVQSSRSKNPISKLFAAIMTLIGGGNKHQLAKRTNCDLYGHLMPDNNWQGQLPVCKECGAEIFSQAHVRSAFNQHILSQDK